MADLNTNEIEEIVDCMINKLLAQPTLEEKIKLEEGVLYGHFKGYLHGLFSKKEVMEYIQLTEVEKQRVKK